MKRRVMAAVLSALSFALPVTAQTRDALTAFVDVTVVPMDTERLLPHQTILVRGDRIAAMGPVADVEVPASAVRIEGQGKYLMPGLADMHTHLSRYSPRSIDRALMLLLANGVTTIRDVEFLPRTPEIFQSLENGFEFQRVQIDGPAMLRLRKEIRAGKRWGPRMSLSSAWYRDSAKSVDQNLARYKVAGYDHLKIYYEYSDTARLDSLTRGAQRLGIPLVSHGYENDFSATLKLGLRSIEHLTPYAYGHVPIPDTTIAEYFAATARSGLWNCVCPPIWIGAAYTELERRYAIPEARIVWGVEPIPTEQVAVQASTHPSAHSVADPVWIGDTATFDLTRRYARAIRGLQRAGAGLLLGTDLPNFPPGFGVHQALQALPHAGLTPYQALLTATRNPAAYAGMLEHAGTVAVGKWADLVLLRANPLENLRNAAEIDGVMAAGRWLSRQEIERRLDRFYGRFLKPLPKYGSVYPRRTSELLGGTAHRGVP